ncbi:MAG: hypothetical protein K0V04_29895 [Deltaproteobacteria bacterium]|nr:hypothetical protein [Deltaproteobacteria bacterium]
MKTKAREPATTLAQAFGLTEARASVAWEAVRAVVEAAGPPGPRGRALLELAAETLEIPSSASTPRRATPERVAAAFEEPRDRRMLVDMLVVPACIDGEIHRGAEAVVRDYARALGVRSPWVDALGAMRRGNIVGVKRRLYTRAPDGRRLFARTWREDGIKGLLQMLRFVLGLYTDPELSARFIALGSLPEGTLGRRFHDQFVERGLAFPGQRQGIPERMVHHDLMHIINGYGTDPAGECEIAGFYAGFCEGDAFAFIVVALATFHLGLPVSPPMVTPTRGAFDPARVLAAFLRGRTLTVDVMGQWDYWSLMPVPLSEVPRRLGLAEAAGEHEDHGAVPSPGLVAGP